ncbi:uncharacterized protein YukE [Paenibacillus anaericanus]|uniref:polymorphic toxin type 30 domain-containing protein n=1 Tax=Paenibacillus anaericanus TaxID=170367 RepID=UPI0027891849|nr:polymorphic toxin type 30 domain-containing protein [Paenibacillus anaericanus]MDQ0087490.1 uncharacterized protein YukE [Paenibacillus anaericanus]
MKIKVEVPELKQTGRDLQQTVYDLENMQSSLQRMMSRLTLESRGRADVDNSFRMINQRLNEIRQELEALSRQATKKGEQFAEADGKGKPIDLRQVWSFVKTGMMGLDFIPIIGNVKVIMKMAIGRDLITEDKLALWERGSAKLTDFADEEFIGVCVRDRDKIKEDTRNGFEKSIDSFQEIGSDFVLAAEERSNKAFDSFGDFLNYVTSGISSGIYEGAKERDERKMDSFYNFGDWLTSGLIGTINGAFNPKEGAFSKGHWLNSLGLAMMIAVPIRAKIPTTPNLRKNIVAPRQKTTQSGIEKQEKVEIKSPKTEEVKQRNSEDLVERSKVEETLKAPNMDLNRIGTGAVGNFQNVKDVNDLISRIPADAKQIPWREVPGGAKEGVKFRWVDEEGKTWDVRAHSVDPTAPSGSNAANGWIYRVEVKQVNPKWKWTMDSKGNFHKENVLRENSPNYDESIANETHIPFTP